MRALELVGLGHLAERYATKLSGGQRQRVALARAIVYEPKVVLFDEPLSNLDAKLREQMRIELVRLQQEVGITSIYVTHDQSEALVMSDRVVVMNKGVIQQIGDPHDHLCAAGQRLRGELHRRRQSDAGHAARPQRRVLRPGDTARRGPRAAAPQGAGRRWRRRRGSG